MAARQKKRSGGAATGMLVRQLHVYLSAFVAPSLIFYAATGSLQIFRLPDEPSAPAVMVKLARLHKDTVFAPKPPRARPAARPGPERRKAEPPFKTTLLKWFFVATGIGTVATALFGVWLALAYSRHRWIALACLATGAILPLALLIG